MKITYTSLIWKNIVHVSYIIIGLCLLLCNVSGRILLLNLYKRNRHGSSALGVLAGASTRLLPSVGVDRPPRSTSRWSIHRVRWTFANVRLVKHNLLIAHTWTSPILFLHTVVLDTNPTAYWSMISQLGAFMEAEKWTFKKVASPAFTNVT